MPTYDALLRDVLDHPDDDIPRLILGDYLLDQPDSGSQARGEFLHTQCLLGELPMDHPDRAELEVRQAQLQPEYPQRWARPFRRRGAKAWAFGRGLVEGVSLRPEQFDRVSEIMWREQPVQRLRLLPGLNPYNVSDEWATRLQKWPDIGRIVALDCSGFRVSSSLLRSHRVAGLREVTVSWLDSPATLENVPWRDTVVALNAAPGGWSMPDIFAPLLHPHRLPRLHSLSTRTLNGVGPLLPQLRRLHLDGVALGGALRLLGNAGPLESLTITGGTGADSLASLLRAPGVSAIDTLELRDVALSDTIPLRVLLGRRLVRLTLANCLNATQVRVFARAGNLSKLRELTISLSGSHHATLASAHTKALAGADLASLLSLSLSGYTLSMGTILDVMAAPWLEQLHTLELRACALGTHAASVLAHRGAWSRLARLDLRGNPLTREDQVLLRQRFGVRVRY